MTRTEPRIGGFGTRVNRSEDGSNPALRRLVGAIPPLLAWTVVTAPLWGAVVAPAAFGTFMVGFSAYWLFRSSEFGLGLLLGLWRLTRSQRRAWGDALKTVPESGRLQHLVIIPTYRESEDVLADTLRSLVHQSVPRHHIAVVLAFEERDDGAPARARRLTARFGGLFGHWLLTFHPDLPGEVKGKSSNLAWAAQRAEEELVRTGRLDPACTLVTVLDADSRIHPEYLAALGYASLTHPNGDLHLYQPAILFYANYWRLPLPLRAVNSVFSLYSLARLASGHRLVPQSTYSLSWRVAQEVGFWDVDVIPEDSHMFFKVWLHVGARVRTSAIYLPVYADAAEGATALQSATSTYQQIRRWAWGVSDIPYLVLGAARAPHIPLGKRAARVWWYLEDHLMWPSHWFLLSFGTLATALLAPQFASSALGAWQAQAVSTLLGLTFPTLILTVLADAILRPRPPSGSRAQHYLSGVVSLLGFIFLPFSGLAMAALPALDAHTRLLFGRSLAYKVTEKFPSTGPGHGIAAPSTRPAPAYALHGHEG